MFFLGKTHGVVFRLSEYSHMLNCSTEESHLLMEAGVEHVSLIPSPLVVQAMNHSTEISEKHQRYCDS